MKCQILCVFYRDIPTFPEVHHFKDMSFVYSISDSLVQQILSVVDLLYRLYLTYRLRDYRHCGQVFESIK